jgi:hypothetical protein
MSDETTWEVPLGSHNPVVKNILIVPVKGGQRTTYRWRHLVNLLFLIQSVT